MKLKVKAGNSMSGKIFKSLYAGLAGLGVIGIVLFVAICMIPIIASIYGIILAFKASILLGVVALFVEPAPFVFGIVMMFGGINLPERIVAWVTSVS